MNKKTKIFIVFVILLIAGFSFYANKLHTLAVEGNEIYALRCTTVNPPLISYKNSFLKFADAAKNPDQYTKDEAAGFYIDYLKGMRDYLPVEVDWINKELDYINRWDFKLFEPWYIKDSANYQVEMYMGYRDEAKASVDAMNGRISNEDFSKYFLDARERRNKYTQLYFDLYDKAVKFSDWRKVFSRVPVPEGCNDKTLTIPDTSGALDPSPPPMMPSGITG